MLLLKNAHIYTMDPAHPQAQALLVDQTRILAVGTEAEVRQSLSHPTNEVDLQGQTIIPGLTDAHLHLQQYALSLMKVDCAVPTRAECLRRVAEKAASAQPGAWILGHGWNQNDWEDGFGSAADLDAVAPHNPVYLTARSLHVGWANSAALHLAGVGVDTPDPPNGRLGRDTTGALDGILFESAMSLIEEVIPQPTLLEVQTAIQHAIPALWQLGITGIHNFDRRLCFQVLQSLHNREALKLRVLQSIPHEALEEAVALGLRSGFGDDTLRVGPLKLFADGALGPHTAAMLQPYADDPGNRGMLFLDREELFEIGRKAAESGISLAVHAIGDRANHEMLAGFDQLRAYERQLNLPRLPHRIEHVQLLHPDDLGRLAELELVASMQPIHATSDMFMADAFWGDRSQYAYAWRSQLNHGARLVFGSDAPVESPNPFLGIHAAVTRQTISGDPGPAGWYPEQRISLPEALHAYTVGPARLAGWGRHIGLLSPGYLADLLILDTDPFRTAAETLKDIHPKATMVGGEWVMWEL